MNKLKAIYTGGWKASYECAKHCKGNDEDGQETFTRLYNTNGEITLNHAHHKKCPKCIFEILIIFGTKLLPKLEIV